MLDTIRSHLKTALVTTCAIAALAAYGQHKGILDIRIYSSSEQAYQARIHHAEALLAREAIPHEEVPAEVAQEHEYAEASVWAVMDHPRKRR